jgi:cell division protein FtsZ
MAISSELLDITIDGARGILFNVSGGDDLTLMEVNQAAAIIKETAHPDVNLIFGAVINPELNDEICLTVIATGFDSTSMHTRMQRTRFTETMDKAAGIPKNEDKENPSQRDFVDFVSQVYNTDEVEIPAYLRNRSQK